MPTNASLPGPSTSSSSVPIASTSSSSRPTTNRTSFQSYTTTTATKPNKFRRTKPHLARAASILAKQSNISSDDDDDDDDTVSPYLPSSFPANAAVPSTSTGITVPTGPTFRAQLQVYDSDEEEDDDAASNQRTNSRAESILNLVPVIPMPLNGTHNFDATRSSAEEEENDAGRFRTGRVEPAAHGGSRGVSSSDGRASPAPAEVPSDPTSTHRAARKRTNASLLNLNYANYSSHSNSRLSGSSSTTDGEDTRQSSLNLPAAIGHKRARLREIERSPAKVAIAHQTDTPNHHHRRTNQHHFTPDSGFLTNVTSSATSNSFQQYSGDSCSSNDAAAQPGTSSACFDPVVASTSAAASSYAHRMFQKKIARVRRNYRKNICEDSDSD